MTKISRKDVLHLAQLSSLQLTDEEIDSLQGDLEAIVAYIAELGSLNTKGVEPTYQVTDLENVTRGDEVIDYGVSREALLSRAPESQDNSVKVPKVL